MLRHNHPSPLSITVKTGHKCTQVTVLKTNDGHGSLTDNFYISPSITLLRLFSTIIKNVKSVLGSESQDDLLTD